MWQRRLDDLLKQIDVDTTTALLKINGICDQEQILDKKFRNYFLRSITNR